MEGFTTLQFYSNILVKLFAFNQSKFATSLMLTVVLILDIGIVFVVIGEQDQP